MANPVPSGLLDFAAADLAAARRLTVPGLYHNACYHAQQAAEKSLKALLLHETTIFPKTHNLSRLVDAIRVPQPTFPDFVLESAVLNEYAVDMRYEPNVLTDVDDDEAQAAIAYAETIMDRIRQFLDESNAPQSSRPDFCSWNCYR